MSINTFTASKCTGLNHTRVLFCVSIKHCLAQVSTSNTTTDSYGFSYCLVKDILVSNRNTNKDKGTKYVFILLLMIICLIDDTALQNILNVSH